MVINNIEYSFHGCDNGLYTLNRVHNAEGYRTNYDAYHYYRRDHLGNNREVWQPSYSSGNTTYPAATVQRTQYYPSGLPWREGLSPAKQPYKFNGCEFVEMHGYDASDFGARGLHHAKNRFDTMDPLAEKRPWESPYCAMGNNPVRYIDPDGREAILALDKDKDKTIIAGAEKYKDDNAIHIFAHGSSRGMSVVVDGKITPIRTEKQLETFLSKNSETWQNKKDGDQISIVLHSCNTGKDGKDGTSSFAQKISGSDTFKDATIIAPNERVYFSESGQIGAYKAKYSNQDGDYLRNESGEIKSKAKSDTPGSWRIFKGGEQTGQYRGDWKPKEQPTIWDNFTKKEQ